MAQGFFALRNRRKIAQTRKRAQKEKNMSAEAERTGVPVKIGKFRAEPDA